MRKSLFFFLLSLFSLSIFAQQKTVSGKVTDQTTGQPIQGVNVSIKGTTTTVVTDATGAFTIPRVLFIGACTG